MMGISYQLRATVPVAAPRQSWVASVTPSPHGIIILSLAVAFTIRLARCRGCSRPIPWEQPLAAVVRTPLTGHGLLFRVVCRTSPKALIVLLPDKTQRRYKMALSYGRMIPALVPFLRRRRINFSS